MAAGKKTRSGVLFHRRWGPQRAAGDATGGMDETLKREIVAFLPRLRRYAQALTGSRADGDDLVQATCERAIRHLDSWQPGSRLDAWLFRIARNLFLNELRARKVRGPQHDIADHAESHASDGRPGQEARLDLARVRRLLERLPEEQRSVLLLIAVEGLSYQETATALDLPMGTVTSRLARGRLALKTLMDGERAP